MNSTIRDYLRDGTAHENANTSFSISGLKAHIASTTLKESTLSQSPAAEYHRSGALHLHDLSGGIWSAYSYFKDNVIRVRIDNNIELLPFECLWDRYEEFSKSLDDCEVIDVCDIKYNMQPRRFAKIRHVIGSVGFVSPTIEIYDGKNYTKITRITKHNTTEKLLKINTGAGNCIIVTANHPVITTESIVVAGDLTETDTLKLYTEPDDINESLYITPDLAYLVGYILGDGYIDTSDYPNISGVDLTKVEELLDKNSIRYSVTKHIDGGTRRLQIMSKQFGRWMLHELGMRKYSQNKNLPTNILQWSIESKCAIVSGLIDSDGTVDKNGHVLIRTNAFAMMQGLHVLLTTLGIVSRLRSVSKPRTRSKTLDGKEIFTNYDLFAVGFNVPHNLSKFFIVNEKKWVAKDDHKSDNYKNKKGEIHNIKDLWRQKGDFGAVYDITTESSIFGLDGVIVHNCRGMDLLQLLMGGIKNPAGTSSLPAKHFDVVMDHIVNSMYVSQNEWEGAQAYSNVDTLISPFIYYDEIGFKEVKQSIQRAVFNLSYPLRAAFQTPFTNWSFDLKCPDHMKDEPVIIGGMPQECIYSEFQNEMDMVNTAFLEVMIEGDKGGNPHTFPIPSYSITKDFDWECPVTDKLFELTTKFGTPYFMSYVGSGLDPSSTRSMCCRLNLRLEDVVEASKGGLWNAGVGTGSLSVVTINMPQLGYLARKDVKDHGMASEFLYQDMVNAFYTRLDVLLDNARAHNVWKREKINEGFEMGLMPFTKSYINDFKSFFSTIGDIGMNECCLNMFGKPIYECTDFVEAVLKYIHAYTRKMTKSYGHPWNFEETPCFSSSTKILVRGDHITRYINIADLIKYDIEKTEIMTPNGFKGIKRFITREYNDKLFRITLANGASMNVTKEHPCVLRDGGNYKIARCDELHIGDEMALNKDIFDDNMRVGDYDLGRLCGLWMAEGHFGGTNSTVFTFHEDETDYIEFVKDMAKTRFGCNSTTYEHRDGFKSTRVVIFGNGVKETIKQFCSGEDCYSKHIKTKVFNTSLDFRRGMIDGIWEGDANKRDDMLSTTSLQLAKDCISLMNSIGVKYNLHPKMSPSSVKTYRDENCHMVYQVTRITDSLHSRTYRTYYKDDDLSATRFYFLPITSIKRTNTPSKHVYDVEVHDDEHLLTLANGIVSHNCEGASHSLALKDKANYPDIITQGDGDGAFYTNSSHIYVGDEVGLGDSLRIQEKFKHHYNGGTLFHIFCGESHPDRDGVKDLIKNVCTNTSIPYLALTRAYAVCNNCGVIDDLSGLCPSCKSETTVWDRVTGFYRPVKAYNLGKKAEWDSRRRFNVVEGSKSV